MLRQALLHGDDEEAFTESLDEADGEIEGPADGSDDNNNKDLFCVIALFPHQLPGKVDPRRWHCQRSRDNAAARMRRHACFHQASANADAKERSTV